MNIWKVKTGRKQERKKKHISLQCIASKTLFICEKWKCKKRRWKWEGSRSKKSNGGNVLCGVRLFWCLKEIVFLLWTSLLVSDAVKLNQNYYKYWDSNAVLVSYLPQSKWTPMYPLLAPIGALVLVVAPLPFFLHNLLTLLKISL